MEVLDTKIPEVKIIRPRVFADARGYFFESFSQREFDEKVRPTRWVQDNESRSSHGVVRGMHFQRGFAAQGKLVRCVVGHVLDVALDIRLGSPTFGQHVAVELTQDNHEMLYVPRGFAHGFAVLSEVAIFQYKCDNYYAPETEDGFFPLDPALEIDWRLRDLTPLLSDKDKVRCRLADTDPQKLFNYTTDYYPE